MAKRKAKAVKVEAVKAWARLRHDGCNPDIAPIRGEAHSERIDGLFVAPVRIIRESDYIRLLKAAKGK